MMAHGAAQAGARISATAAGTVAIPAAALSTQDVVLLVVLPLLAAWVGLAGIGVMERRPTGTILREFIGSVMLGGVAGLVALAAIDLFDLRGYLAALFTLVVGMGALSCAKQLQRISALDPLLAALGLKRKDTDDGN